jgi:MoxR-like ATPase
MKTKIQSLLQQLNQGLVEREHVLKLAMLTTLAGENLVLVGPPGTGKSLVARRIAQSLSHEGDGAGAGYFEYLLTKFSTPEELFGPLSISALKADRFHRNTEGYLPTVRMAFLDEIFKASSSILNALLTVLNERVYHNGTDVQKVPLQALIAASNELPTDQEELAALYDRFLVRVFVDYVGANNLPRLFETTTEPTLHAQDRLSAADLARVRQAADQVVFEPALIEAVQDIWAAHKDAFKEDRRESLSDRRLKKVIHLMRVSAATNGREAVDLSDLMLLKDCLWNHADNAPKVLEVVIKGLRRHSRQVLLTQDADAPTPMPTRTAGRSGSVVTGYSGSGTADDPLLIQSVENLMDLARPEVGQQYYYFRQTIDLDIGRINTWPEIVFQGHYDGRWNTITDDSHYSTRSRCLFKCVEASQVINLAVKECGLAETARMDSYFANCKSLKNLIWNAVDCEIFSCESLDDLISSKAINCKIAFCLSINSISPHVERCTIRNSQSGKALVTHSVSQSLIADCLVIFADRLMGLTESDRGGISARLQDSAVERCFVSGKLVKYEGFSGVAVRVNSSSINRCAIGRFELEGSFFHGRIARHGEHESKFEMNVSVNGNASIAPCDIDGDSVDSARFNQRFFENTLCWDFDQTWVWDDKNNRPALRQVGVGAIPAVKPAGAAAKQQPSVDLLTHQVKTNMWL